ncbi:MAG TPA: hypothetical protein VF661_03600 [Actinomycetales bacterium]|jgi:hypothetical protein
MTPVVVAMLLALLLSLAVVALVAVPARREGRELLTPQGEQLVQTARERTGEAASAARARTTSRTAPRATPGHATPGHAPAATAPAATAGAAGSAPARAPHEPDEGYREDLSA